MIQVRGIVHKAVFDRDRIMENRTFLERMQRPACAGSERDCTLVGPGCGVRLHLFARVGVLLRADLGSTRMPTPGSLQMPMGGTTPAGLHGQEDHSDQVCAPRDAGLRVDALEELAHGALCSIGDIRGERVHRIAEQGPGGSTRPDRGLLR